METNWLDKRLPPREIQEVFIKVTNNTEESHTGGRDMDYEMYSGPDKLILVRETIPTEDTKNRQ